MVHPYDAACLHVIERGDTQDGQYIAPSSIGGLAIFMPAAVAATKVFQMADDAGIEIAGDIRVEVHATLPDWSSGATQAIATKWETTATKAWAGSSVTTAQR
jgi:hypothetical protein